MQDIEALRREGRRLVSRGQAMLDRADNLEAARALGEEPEPIVSRSGATSGITETARDLAAVGWVSAQALAEKTGCDVRNAASCLSRLASQGELEKRKQPGYPVEYRSTGNG